MELLDLRTGYWMAVFADFKSAEAFAEERQSQRAKIAYCGSIKWVRPMEVKRWPKKIPGKGFMDYRYKEADYLARHHGEQPPPTSGGALECIRQTADMLANRQGISAECIVIEKKW
ncbi:hypothetical protein ACXYMU_19240 [Pontibacter sp. CAU 1760]